MLQGQRFFFSKKQGEANLEIRIYQKPNQNKIWLAIQFLGLLILIITSYYLKLFTLKDGYSWKKARQTILLIGIAIFLFNFLSLVKYLYL